MKEKENKMKRTALDAIIEAEEERLAYWKKELHTRKDHEYFTFERMEGIIKSLEFSIETSKRHRKENRERNF